MIRNLLLILVVILALGGLIAYSQYQVEPNRVSGFVEADEIRVGSRVGGRVRVLHVEEGERVRQGQVLIELEPFDLIQREQEALQTLAVREAEYQRLYAGLRVEEIAQAKARHDQFQARYDLLKAGPRQQEIDAAQARLTAAEAELKLAQETHKRTEQLFQRKTISREEMDKASEQLESSQAMVLMREKEKALLDSGTREEEIREAAARLEEAKQAWQQAEKGFRSEEIEQARAARDAAQASLNVVREQIKELQVTAPVDGVIEALDLRQGDLVPAGAPVLSVMDDSHLWVRTYVPQNRVGLQVGQKLMVTADSFPGEQFPGEITFLARQAEFTPSNVQTPEERRKQVFRMKVALETDEKQLRPGMTVDVWLEPGDETP